MRYLIKINIILVFLVPFLGQAQVKDSIAEAFKLQIKEADTDSIKMPLQLLYAEHLALYDMKQAQEITNGVLQKIKAKGYKSNHFKAQLATAYLNLGAFQINSNSSEALYNYFEGLKIFEKIQDSVGLGYGYLNLAYMTSTQDSSKLKQYAKKSITIFKALGEKRSYELALTYTALGRVYYRYNQKDSALYFYEKSKKVNDSSATLINNNTSIGTIYYREKQFDKAFSVYKETIEIAKKSTDFKTISKAFMTQAVMSAEFKAYNKAIAQIDSSIYYAKFINDKNLLRMRYDSRHALHERKGDFKNALKDYKTSRLYSDSINNIDEAKRFKEIELNYEFDKEKKLAAAALKAQETKKKLYFALLLITAISGLILFYFIRKSSKQKLVLAANELKLKHVEKLKADLALANRETALKKVVIENSITEEVLNKTLDDIKQIITFENEKERKSALRSLSAALLSEKTGHKSSSNVQSYIDDIHMDFKVALDANFPDLKQKEKELLYLMKAGLKTSEISKLQNTTLAAIRSNRYRIRKKLGLDSNEDIINFIDKKTTL